MTNPKDDEALVRAMRDAYDRAAYHAEGSPMAAALAVVRAASPAAAVGTAASGAGEAFDAFIASEMEHFDKLGRIDVARRAFAAGAATRDAAGLTKEEGLALHGLMEHAVGEAARMGPLLERAKELLAHAGPLSWVADDDMDSASAWEKAAFKWFADYARAAAPVPGDEKGGR